MIAAGLIERGLLAREDGRYGVISVTPLGREWLRGTESLHLELRSRRTGPKPGHRDSAYCSNSQLITIPICSRRSGSCGAAWPMQAGCLRS